MFGLTLSTLPDPLLISVLGTEEPFSFLLWNVLADDTMSTGDTRTAQDSEGRITNNNKNHNNNNNNLPTSGCAKVVHVQLFVRKEYIGIHVINDNKNKTLKFKVNIQKWGSNC